MASQGFSRRVSKLIRQSIKIPYLIFSIFQNKEEILNLLKTFPELHHIQHFVNH